MIREWSLPRYSKHLWFVLNRIDTACYVFRALGRERQDLLPVIEHVFEVLEHRELLGFNPLVRKH